MVSLSLLKLLELNGFGAIDENLFWEKMSIEDDGLYITDMGGSQDRGSRKSLSYTIYSRAKSDTAAYQKLQAVADFLTRSFSICQLPAVLPITNYSYENVTILPPSSIASVGEDINGRVVYSITGQLYYGEKTTGTIPPVAGDFVETETGQRAITEQNKLILMEK